MGIRGGQPLRDDGEQRHAFPARSTLRGPPADAGLAVLQAGVPSRSTPGENGPPSAPVFFPELRIQSRKRLLQGYGRGDGDGRSLTRRRMAPAAGTAYFPLFIMFIVFLVRDTVLCTQNIGKAGNFLIVEYRVQGLNGLRVLQTISDPVLFPTPVKIYL